MDLNKGLNSINWVSDFLNGVTTWLSGVVSWMFTFRNMVFLFILGGVIFLAWKMFEVEVNKKKRFYNRRREI